MTLTQKERELIARRTRKALDERKKAGVKLGSPNPRKGAKAAARARSEAADERAARLLPHAGDGTLEERANRLNQAGFRTSTGKLFTKESLFRMLRRKS